MFETYGEMETAEEINAVARSLKEDGEKENLDKLVSFGTERLILLQIQPWQQSGNLILKLKKQKTRIWPQASLII